MNLVAKEYVACQAGRDGVLVLSEFAGAAPEMGEAVLVNPYDEERTAAAVRRALEMPARERRERMAALHARVTRNNVVRLGRALPGLARRRGQRARVRPRRRVARAAPAELRRGVPGRAGSGS